MPPDWVLEIIEAAEELGYYVQQIGPGSEVVLIPKQGGDKDRLHLTSVFLTGSYLRNILLPLPKPEPRIVVDKSTSDLIKSISGV